MSHETTSEKTSSKFAVFFHLFPCASFLLGSYQLSSFVFHNCSLKFFEQKLSHLDPFYSLVQNVYKDFELVLLRQTCQGNHVLNYASRNGLGTK